jgi:hypothetical protein
LSEGTTETSPQPPDETGSSGNPWERLSSLLSEFRKARIELDASWAVFSAESGRNDGLRKEATVQAEVAKSSVGVSRAELDLQQRREEISQRPEFVSSYDRQREAKRAVQRLRSELQIPLGRLAVRRPEAKAVLEQLDRLPPELSAHDADIIIGLLEEVLDRSTAGPTGQIDGGLTAESSTAEGVNIRLVEATVPAPFQQIGPLSEEPGLAVRECAHSGSPAGQAVPPSPGGANTNETEHPAAPATVDQPLTGESVGAPDSSPENRLSRFMQEHPGTTLSDIRYSAGVYKPEFQDWRRGKLKVESVMSKRIEDVLSGATPVKKKPPKPRPA